MQDRLYLRIFHIAIYFQLILNGSDSPKELNNVDEDICNYFNAPIDDKHYFRDWYNGIGFYIAQGESYQLGESLLRSKIQEIDEGRPDSLLLIPVLDYLESNYTSKSWSK